MPKLLIKSEGGARVPPELAEELVTVGRGPDNAIRIDDPSVSDRHAQLQCVGDIYRLKDLDSTNGTLVNGQKINETALRFGDRIRFGKIEALFESDVSDQAQPLPELREAEARPAESSAPGLISRTLHLSRIGRRTGIRPGKPPWPRRRSRCSRSSEA
jgi:pSer/pThr/pTyr-binding forkhead associated (FHA) protein